MKLLTPQSIRDRFSKPVSVLLDPALLCDAMERGWYQPAYRFGDEPQKFYWLRVSAVDVKSDGSVELTVTSTFPEEVGK